MRAQLVPPVKATIKQVLLESPIYDQVIVGGKVWLKRCIDVGQLLPGNLCGQHFLLHNEKLKVGKCKLRRKRLMQSDQLIPDVLGGSYFLFIDQQAQKTEVEIRLSRQRLVQNLDSRPRLRASKAEE